MCNSKIANFVATKEIQNRVTLQGRIPFQMTIPSSRVVTGNLSRAGSVQQEPDSLGLGEVSFLKLKSELFGELKSLIASSLREVHVQIEQLRKEAALQAIQQQLVRAHEASQNVKSPVTYTLLMSHLLHEDFNQKMNFSLDAVGGLMKELRSVHITLCNMPQFDMH